MRQPDIIISKDWDHTLTFLELCERTKFCFRFLEGSGTCNDDRKPHLVYEEDEDYYHYVLIGSDSNGITVSAEGKCIKSILEEPDVWSDEDPFVVVKDYCSEIGIEGTGFIGGRMPASVMPITLPPTLLDYGMLPPRLFDFGTPRKPRHCERAVEVRTTPKVGRNEPCSCGSGKKYKMCCGKIQ